MFPILTSSPLKTKKITSGGQIYRSVGWLNLQPIFKLKTFSFYGYKSPCLNGLPFHMIADAVDYPPNILSLFFIACRGPILFGKV